MKKVVNLLPFSPAKLRSAYAMLALVFLFSFTQTSAQVYTIGGKKYTACGSSETVTTQFNNPAGANTTNQYSGLVLITVSGIGVSDYSLTNDAFYVYPASPDPGNYNAGFYQLGIGSGAFVGCNPTAAARNFIVYNASTSVDVTPPYAPAPEPSHTYSFVINANLLPGGVPNTLGFGVTDCGYNDNSGSFTVKVTQLCEDCSNNNKNDKVSVCHNGQSICISINALQTHLAHGDSYAPCQ